LGKLRETVEKHQIPAAQKGHFLGDISQKMPFLRRGYFHLWCNDMRD
jgi:hypothetical protein